MDVLKSVNDMAKDWNRVLEKLSAETKLLTVQQLFWKF